MAKIQTALLSVSDKTGIPEFAQRLAALGVEILSTGGTARLLRESGVQCEDVSDYTGFPEIIDGLVRTLHPKVHAGLLARREQQEHLRQLREQGIRPIDMVVVNLYPFIDVVSQRAVEQMQAIENIDIGGPSLVRSAAKNYTHVAVVTNPAMYDAVGAELEQNAGNLSEQTHLALALEAFRHTAHYDTAIADYLAGIEPEHTKGPERLTLEFVKKQDLPCGENQHQRAAFYVEEGVEEPGAAAAVRVAGPEPCFNVILDVDAGVELIKEFDMAAAVLARHAGPCGAAVGDCARSAFEKAFRCDPLGACGAALVLNRKLDFLTAEAILEMRCEPAGRPVECELAALVAPEFDPEALALLQERAEWFECTRVLRTGPLNWCAVDESASDMRRVTGGLLVQDRDLVGFEADSLKIATRTEPTEARLADLKFAWLCCKHARSEAAVLVADGALVGVGAGQVSRLEAVLAALRKAGDRARGAVLAGDGPFPSVDAVEAAADAGVTAIIQPGGSEADGEVAEAADRRGVAMVMTGRRHFRH